MAALAESVELNAANFLGLPMPLALRLPVRLSDRDLMAFSRQIEPYQLERNANGELEIMSPVKPQGSFREAFVIRILGNWTEEHGGRCLSSNGGVTLRDSSMRSSDTAWISEGSWNALTPEEQSRFAPLCPEFIIEILSESDSRRVLEAKMDQWMENGALLAWLIDPFAAEIVIYRTGKVPEVLLRPESVEAVEVVPGFRLEMLRLWAD